MNYLAEAKRVSDEVEKLKELSEQVKTPDVRDTLTVEELAALLVETDRIMKVAKETKANIEAALGYVMPTDDILNLGDVTVEKVRGAPNTAWRHDALKTVLIEKLLDRARGEDGVIETPYSVLLHEVLDYAGIQYWRAKKLQELGINVSEFSEKGKVKTSFPIRKINQLDEKDTETYDFFD